MKLTLLHPDGREQDVEGMDAYRHLKATLGTIGRQCILPLPEVMRVVRSRACDTLRRGNAIWTENDPLTGQPRGVLTIMKKRIIGIIHEDGTWEGEGEDPRKAHDVPEEER